MVLGALLGGLSVTRTEYAPLLLIVTFLLLLPSLVRSSPVKYSLLSVLLLWIFSLPMLLIQPMVSGWNGEVSFIPPNQSGFLGVWKSRYDLEFTQLRLHRLVDIVHMAIQSPESDLPVVKAKIRELKYNYINEEAIGDAAPAKLIRGGALKDTTVSVGERD